MRSALQGVCVLLVAVPSETRDRHAAALARAGAAVRTAGTAPDALSIVLVDSLDAVVCDVALPGRTGLEWIGTIRALSERSKRALPAIGLVEDEASVASSGGLRGFDECVAKPVSGAALVQRLAKLIAGRSGPRTTRRLPRIELGTPTLIEPEEPPAWERTLEGVTILVIDDRLATLDMLEMALEAAGATVHTSTSGVDGLAVLQSKPIDAVVCDLKMPMVDGHEWIRRVRNLPNPAKREIPAIAMTGDPSWNFVDPLVATTAGFDFHLTKPFEPRTAIDEIARLVRMSRRRDAPGNGGMID